MSPIPYLKNLELLILNSTLYFCYYFIIISMRANPKPDNIIIFFNAQSTLTNTNSSRINWLLSTHSFKLKTGMIGIVSPEFITLACSFLNSVRQILKAFDEIIGKI